MINKVFYNIKYFEILSFFQKKSNKFLVKVEINNSTDDISADENNEQNEHINSNLRLVTISILTIDNGIWMILESSRYNPVST